MTKRRRRKAEEEDRSCVFFEDIAKEAGLVFNNALLLKVCGGLGILPTGYQTLRFTKKESERLVNAVKDELFRHLKDAIGQMVFVEGYQKTSRGVLRDVLRPCIVLEEGLHFSLDLIARVTLEESGEVLYEDERK